MVLLVVTQAAIRVSPRVHLLALSDEPGAEKEDDGYEVLPAGPAPGLISVGAPSPQFSTNHVHWGTESERI